MSYLTETEFRSYYTPKFINELVNDTRDDPTSDESERIVTALEASDDMINSYINTNYDVPLTVSPIPPSIKTASKVLTLYNLSGRRWRDSNEPNKFERDKREIITWLESIKKGTVLLPGVPNNNVDNEVGASGSSSTPVMQRTNISDFY